MKLKLLTNGNTTLLSDESYDFFKDKKCYEHTSGYATFWDKENKKVVYIHRFLMNPPDGMFIDHINRNKLDNRLENLRICTRSQNSFNAKSFGKTSKYRGVSFCKQTKKWKVSIRMNNKQVQVGRYNTEKEAAIIYNEYAKKYHGEFAYVNIID